jgi:glycosyltransferase involved in cell wall biosynthesis
MQAISRGVDVSVVICTFNGQGRLPEVLDALLVQLVPAAIHWEIIVVDNNSTDSTSEVATGYGPHAPVPLVVVKEPRQGLVYARRRGLLASNGRLISFLDDDTIVSTGWVQAVYEFFRTHERAGLVGPKIIQKLDGEPPGYFHLIKRALGITDSGDKTLELTFNKLGHPIGLHSGCRRVAIEPCLQRDSFDVIGRCGNQLSSCEDSVLAYEVRRNGGMNQRCACCTTFHRTGSPRSICGG